LIWIEKGDSPLFQPISSTRRGFGSQIWGVGTDWTFAAGSLMRSRAVYRRVVRRRDALSRHRRRSPGIVVGARGARWRANGRARMTINPVSNPAGSKPDRHAAFVPGLAESLGEEACGPSHRHTRRSRRQQVSGRCEGLSAQFSRWQRMKSGGSTRNNASKEMRRSQSLRTPHNVLRMLSLVRPSASRTGSCVGPCAYRTSCARQRAGRGSRSPSSSASCAARAHRQPAPWRCRGAPHRPGPKGHRP